MEESSAPAPADAEDAASVTLPEVYEDAPEDWRLSMALAGGDGEGAAQSWPADDKASTGWDEKPRLPEGWAEHIDDATQHPYYHHEALNVTQWEFPSSDQAYEEEDVSRAVEAPEDDSIESWEVAAPAPSKKIKPRKQNKDYIALADAYKLEKQYRDLKSLPTCVMCHRNPCHDVLFPCEHKCVCRSCLQTNGIGESREEGKWPLCPLCCQEIKRILPSDGREVEKYWNWVLEVEPRLPPKFAQRFEFAGAYLRNHDDPPQESCACAIS